MLRVLIRIFLLIVDVMHVRCTLQGCGAGVYSSFTFVPGNGSVLTRIWFFCRMDSTLLYGVFAVNSMNNLTLFCNIGPQGNRQNFATLSTSDNGLPCAIFGESSLN